MTDKKKHTDNKKLPFPCKTKLEKTLSELEEVALEAESVFEALGNKIKEKDHGDK